MDVYISGVGMTKFGRSKDPLEKMMARAATLALQDAQLERVDAIYIGVTNVEEFAGESNLTALLADTLGLVGTPSTRIETASSSPLSPRLSRSLALAMQRIPLQFSDGLPSPLLTPQRKLR